MPIGKIYQESNKLFSLCVCICVWQTNIKAKFILHLLINLFSFFFLVIISYLSQPIHLACQLQPVHLHVSQNMFNYYVCHCQQSYIHLSCLSAQSIYLSCYSRNSLSKDVYQYSVYIRNHSSARSINYQIIRAPYL